MGSINIREIKISDSLVAECAKMVRKYSWGEDYPVNPLNELERAKYIIGAFDREKLVGCASVAHSVSPDNIDNEKLWISHAVVLPDYRKKGIFNLLYKKQINYTKKHKGPLLAATDNPIVEKFLLKNGWAFLRTIKDEGGNPGKVFIKSQFP